MAWFNGYRAYGDGRSSGGSTGARATGYPSDLRDAEWTRLEPMIPPARPGGRPPNTHMRAAMNAILYFAARRLLLALSAARQLSAALNGLQHLSQVPA